jgi:hypothetical protein
MHLERLPLTLLLVALVGCGTPGPAVTDAGQDLSATPDDATVVADATVLADLTASVDRTDLAPLGCAGMVACTRTCTDVDTGPCVTACIARGSSAAMAYFQPLQQCAGPACSQNPTDAGPPPCSNPSSQACIDCVQQSCATELAACQAN